ncbi:threonine/serine exporter family protein [Aestuariimicrobium soli]|uniref:threonine/serine exporter family protein n=1 Tax=Aestuariimicrobium soli TaxID=2035834 RepID=UPI003EB80907
MTIDAPDSGDARQLRDKRDLRMLLQLAALLVASGMPVHEVELNVSAAASRIGHRGIVIGAAPTLVQLALAEGEPSSQARVPRSLRLDQTLALSHVLTGLHRSADEAPSVPELMEQLGAVTRLRHRHGWLVRHTGDLAVALGIGLVLQPGWTNLAVIALCSVVTSALMRLAARHRLLGALLPIAASALASLIAFAAFEAGFIQGPVRTMICAIAVLLPGAVLATGMAELATGQMVAGSSRTFFGLTQLLLFTLGIVAAAAVLRVPHEALADTRVAQLGWWALPLGIIVIALGITVSEGLPTSHVLPVALLTVVTAVVQNLGRAWTTDIPAGPFLGAMVAAFGSTALAAWRPAIPRLVTFLPSFWLLVPGTLGVLGLTGLANGQSVTAIATVVMLIVGIASGLLVGSALALPVQRWGRRLSQPLTATASASARSVRSQVIDSSSRPKWP